MSITRRARLYTPPPVSLRSSHSVPGHFSWTCVNRVTSHIILPSNTPLHLDLVIMLLKNQTYMRIVFSLWYLLINNNLPKPVGHPHTQWVSEECTDDRWLTERIGWLRGMVPKAKIVHQLQRFFISCSCCAGLKQLPQNPLVIFLVNVFTPKVRELELNNKITGLKHKITGSKTNLFKSHIQLKIAYIFLSTLST